MTTSPLAACGHPFEHHSDEMSGRWCSDCKRLCETDCRAGDPALLITINLPADVARFLYDEVQGRLEFLGIEGDMDERNPADIHVRVFRALETTLEALDAAGSGPSPLGTYRPLP